MYRVLIVDDSAFMRQLIRTVLEESGEFSVSIAQTPLIALDRIRKFNFDLITIDYEMPFMNGIELIKKIKELTNSKILMISAYTQPGAHITLEALSAGAFDYILKPSNIDELDEFKSELVKKIKAVCETCIKTSTPKVSTLPEITKQQISDELLERARQSNIVGIGISTGGPPALEKIFKNLKKDFNLPILVVQHMPANFTRAFAERLATITGFCIKEAEDKEEIKNGCIYIAKGGYHLAVEQVGGKYYTRLLDLEKVKSHKPSADILFSSIADTYGSKSIGIIMTGMGSDGADGILEMKRIGALTIAQDERSCVVFGMPKAAIEKGAIDVVLDIDQMIEFLNRI